MSATGETFYSSISSQANAQLKARENLVSADFKTAEQLTYLNSNTGFIKVTSGVNSIIEKGGTYVPDEYIRNVGTFPGFEQPGDVTYEEAGGDKGVFVTKKAPDKTSSYLAQRVILFNGTAFKEGSGVGLRSGFDYNKATSFVNSDKAYNNYNSLGIRPMPGVTGFDIQSYNPYGTLRIANVRFVVHSLEDLDLAEKLFLRPGYSCIVEFGHSVYIDNSGNIQKPKMGSTTLSNSTLFGQEKKIIDVENQIEKKRKNSNFNYDAFFGYVTNFDYSFRPDGGFDCSIKIASKGQVLDSIKSGNTTDSITIVPDDPEKRNDKKADYLKSIYHFWLSTLKAGYEKFSKDKAKFVQEDLIDIIDNFKDTNSLSCQIEADLNELKNKFHAIYTTVTERKKGFILDSTDAVEKIYIPLRFLLTIFNSCGSLYSGLYNGPKQRLLEFETINSNKYNRFNKLFSTKIGDVLIPTDADYSGTKYTFKGNGKEVFDVNQKLTEYCKDGLDKILDIHISVGMLEEKLEPFVKDTGDTINFVDFLKGVLGHINSSLGNIVSLDIYFNESQNKYEIVDRYGPKPKTIRKINLSGLKSTVKDLSIASSVTNNIAAQIAIAAQGRSTTYPTNVKSIRGFNEGYTDRFIIEKLNNNDTKENTRSKPMSIGKFFNDNPDVKKMVDLYWKTLNEEGEINADDQDQVEKELYKILLIAYNHYLESNNLPSPIPIPVELSFTIKGFSGFKIGQSFRIQDSLLLPKYKKYCYIITGLEHRVEANEWVTMLKAQFFDLDL